MLLSKHSGRKQHLRTANKLDSRNKITEQDLKYRESYNSFYYDVRTAPETFSQIISGPFSFPSTFNLFFYALQLSFRFYFNFSDLYHSETLQNIRLYFLSGLTEEFDFSFSLKSRKLYERLLKILFYKCFSTFRSRVKFLNSIKVKLFTNDRRIFSSGFYKYKILQ